MTKLVEVDDGVDVVVGAWVVVGCGVLLVVDVDGGGGGGGGVEELFLGSGLGSGLGSELPPDPSKATT